MNAKCPSFIGNFSTLSVYSLAFDLSRESYLLVLPLCLISRVIICLLIVNSIRALAVPLWPLSVSWRCLVRKNDSITDFKVY